MSEREENNLHLGDALNRIESALSAGQGLREELIRDAAEILKFVTTQEGAAEL